MDEINVGILTVSDRCFKGEYEDKSGPSIIDFLTQDKKLNEFVKLMTFTTQIVDDEEEKIYSTLLDWTDNKGLNLIFTTGGTGFTPRDVTPEATRRVIKREAQGLIIAMMTHSLQITPFAMLSRAVAGIRDKTLIVNLPGSEKACKENLEAIIKSIPHALLQLNDLKKGH